LGSFLSCGRIIEMTQRKVKPAAGLPRRGKSAFLPASHAGWKKGGCS
jgi:hypothetical protein